MNEASQVFPVHLRPVADIAWYGELRTQWTGIFLKSKSFEGERSLDCTDLLSVSELMVFPLGPVLKEEVSLEQVFKEATGGGLWAGVLIESQQHNLSGVGHRLAGWGWGLRETTGMTGISSVLGQALGGFQWGDSEFLRNTKKYLVDINIHQVREQYSFPCLLTPREPEAIEWEGGADWEARYGSRCWGQSASSLQDSWSRAGLSWGSFCCFFWQPHGDFVYWKGHWIHTLTSLEGNLSGNWPQMAFTPVSDTCFCLLGTPKTPWGREAVSIRCR